VRELPLDLDVIKLYIINPLPIFGHWLHPLVGVELTGNKSWLVELNASIRESAWRNSSCDLCFFNCFKLLDVDAVFFHRWREIRNIKAFDDTFDFFRGRPPEDNLVESCLVALSVETVLLTYSSTPPLNFRMFDRWS
jgi:hypothetical protein